MIIGTSHLGSVLGSFKQEFIYLDSLFENNFRSFDLAASYKLGGTERLFGAWLKIKKNREELFLISKGGHPYPIIKPNRLHKYALERDLNNSLKRLNTDYLDLYMLHRDNSFASLEEICEFFEQAKKSGKIKSIGLSNWHHLRIKDLGLDIQASSPHYSLASWTKNVSPWPGCVSISGKENQSAREFYTQTQIPIYAWSALSGGYFSDYNPKIYNNFPNASKRNKAKKLGVELDLSPAQIALAYICSQDFLVKPIVASKNIEHLIQAQEACEINLSKEQINWLES